MDLWGFEKSQFLFERPGLYLAKPPSVFSGTTTPPPPAPPPGGGGGGGTGGTVAPGKKPAGGVAKFKVGKTDYEAKFSPVDGGSDSAINEAAKKAVDGKVAAEHLGPGPLKYDVYYDKDESGTIDFNKEQINSSASPLTYDIQAAKGAIYRAWMMGDKAEEVSYVEEDGTQDLSQKEAKQIIDQLKKSHDKDWSETLKKNPKIRVGIDKEMSLRDVEAKGSQDQYGIEDPKKDGSPGETTPFQDPYSTSEARKAYLTKIGHNIDRLIEALLDAIAAGDIDVIVEVFNLLSTKSGVQTAELANIVGQALNKLNKNHMGWNDKLVEALKSGDPAKVQEAKNAFQQGEVLKGLYYDLLREGATRQQAAQDIKTSITSKMEHIKLSAQVWR